MINLKVLDLSGSGFAVEEDRNDAGIRDTMMRLSVGIENVEDLIADIEHALA